jgi:hypothetical protein
LAKGRKEPTVNVINGPVLLQKPVDQFQDLILREGEHSVACGDEVYIQPYVYLSAHLIQMRAQGWDVDFDQLAAVSGASALFGYQPDDFMPKYAHLMVDPDRRIAEATGFGYEWVPFEGQEGAWQAVVESVDAGTSVKGWDWENILFAGYQDAETPADRQVYAMADGPGTYSRWCSWEEFGEWAKRMEGWNQCRLGRYAGPVEPKPAAEVAERVLRDLVAWSTEHPAAVADRWPQATYGLAGIERLAATLAASDPNEDWVACHPINGQWTVRNSTGVYLKRVAEDGLFSAPVNAHLLAAAAEYRAAYESWRQLYNDYLGHGVPEEKRKTKEHRVAGANTVRQGLEHEQAALAEVERALAVLG